MKSILSFPNPVNEVAARSVAGMVLALALATILTGEPWLLLFLVYGFVARVLTGPTLSPIGLIATRLVVPLLNIPEKPEKICSIRWVGRLLCRCSFIHLGQPHSWQERAWCISGFCRIRKWVWFLCWMLRVWLPDAMGSDPRGGLSCLSYRLVRFADHIPVTGWYWYLTAMLTATWANREAQ